MLNDASDSGKVGVGFTIAGDGEAVNAGKGDDVTDGETDWPGAG